MKIENSEAGLKLKAVKTIMLKRINVDTTVQEKEVRFPTDARLYDQARQRLDWWMQPKRGRTAKSMWRWMIRRAAIEPGVGHLKREHRMNRNRLNGIDGDCFNASLSTAGMYFAKLLNVIPHAAKTAAFLGISGLADADIIMLGG